MKTRAAILLAVLLMCCIPLPAIAGETTGSIEPTIPAETPAPPPVTILEESGPVGVWLSLTGGAGTDSRTQNSAQDVTQVRWTFELEGAPIGTEFHLWAQYAEFGEVQAVGVDRLTVVTPAHDVLSDAYGHCILESLEEGVSVRLAGVEVVVAPVTAEPVSDEAPSAGTGAPAPAATAGSTSDGEEFLPFTGGDDRLPVLAVMFAAAGLALRRYGARVV